MVVGYENTCTGTVPVIYLWHILNHHHLGVVVGGLSCGPWERIIFPEFHLLQLDDMSGTAVRFSWCGLESARKLSPPPPPMNHAHGSSTIGAVYYSIWALQRAFSWLRIQGRLSKLSGTQSTGWGFYRKISQTLPGIEPEILTPQPLTHLLFNKTP